MASLKLKESWDTQTMVSLGHIAPVARPHTGRIVTLVTGSHGLSALQQHTCILSNSCLPQISLAEIQQRVCLHPGALWGGSPSCLCQLRGAPAICEASRGQFRLTHVTSLGCPLHTPSGGGGESVWASQLMQDGDLSVKVAVERPWYHLRLEFTLLSKR